ncbi:MMPL family transporter [Tessaracoccus lubricantis]|uniref:MMPL family transporter n=1 Tax=Tessaracoccus lubricantis TaxID=545543 RepID=A0ABP9F8H8_9ACTN
MSAFLYRLGRTAATRPLAFLAAWLLVIAAVVGLLLTQTPSISSRLTLDDAPAQLVLDEVTAALPEAGGTQGTLVFSADDGGRVDSPDRADAISRSLDAAVGTGIVLDRDARLEEQRAEVETTVRATVEGKVADEVRAQLESLITALEGAVPSGAPAASPAQQESMAALGARLNEVTTTARALVAAPDQQLIAESGAFFAEVGQLRAELQAMGVPVDGFPAPEPGMTDPAAAVDDAAMAATDEALGRLDGLLDGTSPSGTSLVASDGERRTVVVSDDGTVAIASIQLTEQISDLPEGSLDDLLSAVDGEVAGKGLAVAASSALQPMEPPIGGSEAIGLAIAAVVLLLTLGSLTLAGLPILLALVGVFIGVGGAYALSANFEMTTSTPALGLMLGLAVGIDYALFIIHKHSSLRARLGLDAVEATARAVATAGGAVLFAGLTVVIALLGLLTLGMGFVSTMAVTAAVTVILAIALSLTALPALLGLLGRGRRARTQPVRAHLGHEHSRFGRMAKRWVEAVTARPILTIVLIVLGLGALSLPAAQMQLGMPSGAVAAPGSDQRVAYDSVTHALGEGANAPLIVALTPSDAAAVDQDRLEAWQSELATHETAANVQLMGTSEDRSLVLYTVVPDAGPTDESTADLVTAVRAAELDGVERIGVTGLTAINIDLSESLAEAIPVYLSLVAALSLIVLLVVFRSVVVPLAATAGFLLSIGATMGLVVTAFGNPSFTWLVGVDRAGPVLSFLPIMATGILYGLAMDYQVFLGTSIREAYVHGETARLAVVDGFHHASRVVVAVAIIMVSVFGGFVLSEDSMIRQFGFALAVGILIDAFVIRMALIPAVLHLAGDHAWWLPGWLDRILPEVDVEGTRLEVADAVVEDAPREEAPVGAGVGH